MAEIAGTLIPVPDLRHHDLPPGAHRHHPNGMNGTGQPLAGRATAAGASEDEIADVLLAIVPAAGLGRGRLRRSRCGDRARV
jgi:hypothetical protein